MKLYEARASSTRPRPPAAQSSTSVPTTTASPQLQPAGLSTRTSILQWPLAGPLPVTPVPAPQTSALDSQGTDLQALLASALQQMAGKTQLGTAQGESPMTSWSWGLHWIPRSRPRSGPTSTLTWVRWCPPPNQQVRLSAKPATTNVHDATTGNTHHHRWTMAACTQHVRQRVRGTLSHRGTAHVHISVPYHGQATASRRYGLAVYDERFRRIHALVPSLP